MAELVLWDVEHTLIDTRGVGRELSAAAFMQTTGQPMHRQRLPDVVTHAARRTRGPGHLPLIVYVLPALSGIMWITLLLLI